MGDDDEGLAKLVAQVEEQLVQLFLVLGVERAAGLVGQDDGRAVDQGTGHGHALLLAAGELVRLVVGAVGQSHKPQQLFSPLAGRFTRGTGNVGRYHDVLDGRKLRQQLVELEHEADVSVAEVGELFLREGGGVDAIDTYGAAVRAVQRADNLQQGRLAGPAGTDDAYHLATVDGEVDAFQYL